MGYYIYYTLLRLKNKFLQVTLILILIGIFCILCHFWPYGKYISENGVNGFYEDQQKLFEFPNYGKFPSYIYSVVLGLVSLNFYISIVQSAIDLMLMSSSLTLFILEKRLRRQCLPRDGEAFNLDDVSPYFF